MVVIVVEETLMDHVNTREWKMYCKNMKSNNDHIWNRDFCMTKFLKTIHIIMVSDKLQLVFHKNLHVNLYYSISKKKNLDLIHAFGNFSGIDVIV